MTAYEIDDEVVYAHRGKPDMRFFAPTAAAANGAAEGSLELPGWVCVTCGAVVAHRYVHSKWHWGVA